MFIGIVVPPSTDKIEVARFHVTLLSFYETTRRNNLEESRYLRVLSKWSKGAYTLASRTCNATAREPDLCSQDGVPSAERTALEPLVRIRRESVFSTNTKGCSVQVGTAS